VVASAVFTQPEAASVGLSEAKAATRLDGQIKVFRTRFNPMRNAMAKRSQKTMMKVVVAAATDRVLGFHMVGPGASEQVQCLAAAVSAGVTKHQLDRTLALHPTAAEEWVLLREPVPLSFHAFS
jgi:glutathione reductase (NADPH)